MDFDKPKVYGDTSITDGLVSTANSSNRNSLRGMDTNNTSSPDHSNILLKNSTTCSTSSTRLTVLIKSLIENFM